MAGPFAQRGHQRLEQATACLVRKALVVILVAGKEHELLVSNRNRAANLAAGIPIAVIRSGLRRCLVYIQSFEFRVIAEMQVRRAVITAGTRFADCEHDRAGCCPLHMPELP